MQTQIQKKSALKPQQKLSEICHKHLATKTHNNKRQKISQTRVATKLPKKQKPTKPKKKNKKLTKKLTNRKMRIY